MKGALAAATQSKPFSNGTEGEAWMGVWCEFCVYDHGLHVGNGEPGCALVGDCMIGGDEWLWPEAWLPEPTGSFSLPSRMICGQFQPCTEDGCIGDPHAETRAAITAEVTQFWKENR